jgi:hypothetical protein
MTKLYCIYPTDQQQSTKFLSRINTYLKRKLDSHWHCYKVKFTDADHAKCIESALRSNSKTVLFMGHGNSINLFGSCAKESNEFISLGASEDNPQFYKNENFINCSNIGVFSDKIMISFSCFSSKNDKSSLGRNAIIQGVSAFVGFGDIPTDYIEQNDFPPKAISVYKGIITKVMRESLYLTMKEGYSVKQFVDLVKILTCKEIQKLLFNHSRFRHTLIKQLFDFKNGIRIFGDYYQKVY